MITTIFRLLIALVCLGLHLQGSARQNKLYPEGTIDELRLELSDLKHELHSARVEINLLEERIGKQDRVITASAAAAKNQEDKKKLYSSEIEPLSKKVDRLEKIIERALSDLRNLSANENKAISKIQELESSIALQEKKFEEIGKLKSTLASISKAIGQSVLNVQKAHTVPFAQTYQVKPGDSLEKIARTHGTTVVELKAINQLANEDKIRIGQELKVSSDERK
jgi:LysM repeat protein